MAVLIKVAAIAVAGTVFGLVVKKNNPEMALMLTLALAFAALYLAFDTIRGVVDFIEALADSTQMTPEVLTVVFKTVGISIVTKLASDVCRDAGQTSVASGVELVGAFTALFVALPLFETVIGMVEGLV